MLDKNDVYQSVRAKVLDATDGKDSRVCLYWAIYGLLALKPVFSDVIIQAGNCNWPRLPRERWTEDNSGFGYEWSYTRQSALAVAGGNLPEIHIWLGIVSTQEIVDFSSGSFPAACKQSIKMDWLADRPPEFLWCPAAEVGPTYGASYSPQPEACYFVHRLVRELGSDDLSDAALSRSVESVSDLYFRMCNKFGKLRVAQV